MSTNYQHGDIVQGEVLDYTGSVFELDSHQEFMQVRLADGSIREVAISIDDRRPPIGSAFEARVMNPLVRYNAAHKLIPYGLTDETELMMLHKIKIVDAFGHDQTSSNAEFKRRRKLGLLHFSDEEFHDILTTWNRLSPSNVEHTQAGVRLTLQNNSTITITRDRVFADASNDETARTLVLHAKEFWNGSLNPLFEGHEDIKAKVWAHCQVHGVKYGWEPSPGVARAMQPEIARLIAAESARTAGVGRGQTQAAQLRPVG